MECRRLTVLARAAIRGSEWLNDAPWIVDGGYHWISSDPVPLGSVLVVVQPYPFMRQLLILGGAVGPSFFIALFLIEGATRRSYDSFRQPVSTLALGDRGWIQRSSFVVTGALTLGFVASFWMAPTGLFGMQWVAFLLGLYSFGLVGSGVFVTDPIGGYPLGAPVASPPAGKGFLHGLFSLVVFVPLFAACLVASGVFALVGMAGWAAY